MARLPKRHFFSGIFLIVLGLSIFVLPKLFSTTYSNEVVKSEEKENVIEEPKIIHLDTPEPLKAIYMSACVAGTPSWRTDLMKFAENTEINAIMIDVKDYTGTVSFDSKKYDIEGVAGTGCRVKDMEEFLRELHDRDIYTIARITVFQDPFYSKRHPELAVKRKTDGAVWKDRKGLSFIDVGAKPYWDYIIKISKASYEIGFDELNFDYVRYPSDGDMKNIDFTWSTGYTKKDMLKNFFSYLHGELKGLGAATSVDLFGMTTTNTDDLNIGQVLEYALPYFDYVAPMVYPSHFPPKFNGWANPNDHVYELIKFTMGRAAERATAASTTPLKLRTWIQDFDYGGNYGTKEVRDQIQATYDAGLTSWMVWDPGNKYTRSAFTPE